MTGLIEAILRLFQSLVGGFTAPASHGRSVDALARDIVTREGGYVNDPDDPGGATKYGVTIGTMKALRMDLDDDGDVDVRDVVALTPEGAVEVFKREYFYRPRIDALPEPLQPAVFDMQVNAGSNAVRILQRVLRGMGYQVTVDGVIGPQTAGAAQKAHQRRGASLVDAYGAARRDYYYALADRHPSSRKYARTRDGGKGGWIKRAEEFMRPSARLTEAQHHERTRRWA